ncbi:MAG: HlyD family secretion protein [Halieaceae bacterium]|jgi:HlyD family secretion protein
MIKDTSMQDIPLSAQRAATSVWRKRAPWIALLLGGLLVTMFAYPAIERWSSAGLTLDASRLRLATVERGAFVRDVSVQGQIVAAVRPVLFSPEDGRVTTLVRSGDKVAVGDLLAEVESPELLSQHQQEQATLQKLDTELARQAIEARVEKLKQKESVDIARMDLVAAQRELRRAKIAHDNNAISLQDYEKAVDDDNRAKALYEHKEEEVVLSAERLKLELSILNHAFTRQRLLVEELDRKVAELRITSPVNGVIGNLAVEQKSIVARYQPLLTVVDMSAYEVEAQVPEAYAGDLSQGMYAEIDFSGDKYAGELSAISPQVESGQVRCRIRFKGVKPAGLRQNQRVTSRILIDSRSNVLMVARGPFMQSGARGFVYLVEDDMAIKTPFEAGMSSVGRVEVLAGLSAGQEIVISSVDAFKGHDSVMLLR